MSNNLIVYFSRNGENYAHGEIVDLKNWNTEVAAKIIHSLIDSTLFQVETVHPYAKDYHACTTEAKKELENNERPKILDYVHQFTKYDNIFICYPNWWSTVPMPLLTFLESHHTDGKQIYPLCTHEGSGMGISVDDIKKICPNAIVHDGLAIRGSEVNKSKNKIEEWIKNKFIGEKNGY